MNKLNSGLNFVFKRTLNLLIGAESAVRQSRIRPNFLSLNFTLLKCKRLSILLYSYRVVFL
ncbi:hypothetical protein [Leptospira noguchii]|uniref:hypothetical protein n=1 Tax=Leptospira noguchii TaxID=28182 RepID=UPI0018DEEC3A